jgi:hypothetical protein
MPDLVGPGPPWLYYSFAFGLWAYETPLLKVKRACIDSIPATQRWTTLMENKHGARGLVRLLENFLSGDSFLILS